MGRKTDSQLSSNRAMFSLSAMGREPAEAILGFPLRPPLTALKTRLDAQRARGTRLPSDGFRRQTWRLPREAAREKARQMLDSYPRAAYWTEIESWSEFPGDEIEFTMRWLESAD